MPYSITTKDGITLNNIPDNVDPDSAELRQRVADIRAQRTSGSDGQRSDLERQITGGEEPETTASGVIGAATRGIAPIATGAALGAAAGAPIGGVGAIPGALAGAGAVGLTQFVGDPIVSLVNNTLGTNYQLPTEAMQDLLTRLGVAEPKTAAERIVQTVTAGAASAGGTMGVGKALSAAKSPTTAAVGQQLAAQPLMQVAGGAGAGVGSQGVAEAGGGPVAQLVGGIVGGIAGAKVAPSETATRTPIVQSNAQQDVELAKRHGIDLMTSDVISPKTFASKWAQSAGEKIPYAGTGPVRATQQDQRIDAMRTFFRQYGVDEADGVSEKIMKDLAAKRGDALSNYSTLKSEVIDRLNAKGSVPVSGATKEIDDNIASLESMKTSEVAPLISMLQDFKQAINGQGLRNIEELRKQLGKSLQANPNLASVKDRGEKIARDIYRALNDDMGSFIKTNGQTRDFTKWKVANKRLESLVGDLKVDSLKRVLAKGDATPEVVEKMIFSKKPSEMRTLYAGLTDEGRANARTAIVAKAAKASESGGSISPEKFTNEMQRLAPSVSVFFSDKDMIAVNGLTRALDLTRQASKASLAPATGVQASIPIGAAVLTDMLGSGGAAIASGASIGLMARAYESAPVRNILLKLANTKRGSNAEMAAFKALTSTIQAQNNMKEDEK